MRKRGKESYYSWLLLFSLQPLNAEKPFSLSLPRVNGDRDKICTSLPLDMALFLWSSPTALGVRRSPPSSICVEMSRGVLHGLSPPQEGAGHMCLAADKTGCLWCTQRTCRNALLQPTSPRELQSYLPFCGDMSQRSQLLRNPQALPSHSIRFAGEGYKTRKKLRIYQEHWHRTAGDVSGRDPGGSPKGMQPATQLTVSPSRPGTQLMRNFQSGFL